MAMNEEDYNEFKDLVRARLDRNLSSSGHVRLGRLIYKHLEYILQIIEKSRSSSRTLLSDINEVCNRHGS